MRTHFFAGCDCEINTCCIVPHLALSSFFCQAFNSSVASSGLARMNMILHDNPTAEIKQGNTLADPKFREGKAGNESLKVFDYVVANPPFSDKRWSTGLDP